MRAGPGSVRTFFGEGPMLPWQCWVSLQDGPGGYSLLLFSNFCFISSMILGAFWKLSQKSDNDPCGCLGLGNPKFLTAMLISQRDWHYRAEGLRLCPRGHWGVVEGSRDRRNRLDLIFKKSPRLLCRGWTRRGA